MGYTMCPNHEFPTKISQSAPHCLNGFVKSPKAYITLKVEGIKLLRVYWTSIRVCRLGAGLVVAMRTHQRSQQIKQHMLTQLDFKHNTQDGGCHTHGGWCYTHLLHRFTQGNVLLSDTLPENCSLYAQSLMSEPPLLEADLAGVQWEALWSWQGWRGRVLKTGKRAQGSGAGVQLPSIWRLHVLLWQTNEWRPGTAQFILMPGWEQCHWLCSESQDNCVWFMTASLQRGLSPLEMLIYKSQKLLLSSIVSSCGFIIFFKYPARSKDQACILTVMWNKPWGRILFLQPWWT